MRYDFTSVSETKKKRSKASDRPYARYAFLNPYNLSLLAGAGTTALATGHWWIAVCAAGAEAIWMLFAPESRALQAIAWDKRWEADQRAELEARQNKKFTQLTPQDQSRALLLRDQRARIMDLAKENPSLTVELMRDELAKLDELLEDFLDLATVCARSERQLQGFDIPALNKSWQQYEKQVKNYKQGDKRRDVAQKNLEVLSQRRERMDAMQRNLQTARGHMDLMENSFRLLGDEIVTMADPTELATRLDELRIGVQAIRESSVDEDAQYAELEALEEDEAPNRRAHG